MIARTKVILGALIFTLIFVMSSTPAMAANNEATGRIYTTDVQATVNGIPIPSYRIDGETAIIIEDLVYYGFDVTYDDQSRSLNVDLPPIGFVGDGLLVMKGQEGVIIGSYYQTDIQTIVDGIVVPSYAFDGKMFVTIKDLGSLVPSISYFDKEFHANLIALNITDTDLEYLNPQYPLQKTQPKNPEEDMTLRFSFGIERFVPEYESYGETVDFMFPAGSVARVEDAFDIGFKSKPFNDEIKYWSVYPESEVNYIKIEDGILTIDFIGARPDAHSGGSEGYMIRGNITGTMFKNYDVDVVYVTYNNGEIFIDSGTKLGYYHSSYFPDKDLTLKFCYLAEDESGLHYEFAEKVYPYGSVSTIAEALSDGLKNPPLSESKIYHTIPEDGYISRIRSLATNTYVYFGKNHNADSEIIIESDDSFLSEFNIIQESIAITMFLNYRTDVVNIVYGVPMDDMSFKKASVLQHLQFE